MTKPGARPKRSIPAKAAPPSDKPGIKNPYVRFRPLEKPRVALHDTTLWDYPSQHYGKTLQGDPNYRGATPSHIVWNLISRYTKKGDLVVDPFVGSGTTLDVCKDLERRGKGFDLQTTRTDVVIADARTALSKEVDRETAHLVFMDPPYADNLVYSDDARCIGRCAFEDGAWSEAMADVIDGAMQALKPGGHLACFVSDVLHVQDAKSKEAGRTTTTTERRFANLGLEFSRLALERGMVMVDHVAVVRHGKALDDPRLKARAQAQGFMLRGFSHLIIFQKPTVAMKAAAWKRTPLSSAQKTPWTARGANTSKGPATTSGGARAGKAAKGTKGRGKTGSDDAPIRRPRKGEGLGSARSLDELTSALDRDTSGYGRGDKRRPAKKAPKKAPATPARKPGKAKR